MLFAGVSAGAPLAPQHDPPRFILGSLDFLVCEEYGRERTKHRQRKVGEKRLCTEKVEPEEHHEEQVEAVQTRAREVQRETCQPFACDRRSLARRSRGQRGGISRSAGSQIVVGQREIHCLRVDRGVIV